MAHFLNVTATARITIVVCAAFGISLSIFEIFFNIFSNRETEDTSVLSTYGSRSLKMPEEEKQSEGSSKERSEIFTAIHDAISIASLKFIKQMFGACTILIFIFVTIILFSLTVWAYNWILAALVILFFVAGISVSISWILLIRKSLVFFVMRVISAAQKKGVIPSFRAIFRVGTAIGMSLVSSVVIVLFALMEIFKAVYQNKKSLPLQTPESINEFLLYQLGGPQQTPEPIENFLLYQYNGYLCVCIGAFAFGSTMVSLFCHYGAGIFNASTTVAMLANSIIQDSKHAPAGISYLIGNIIGDCNIGPSVIATLSINLTLVIRASNRVFVTKEASLSSNGWGALCYPLAILSVGIVISSLTSLLATCIATPWKIKHLDQSLKLQTLIPSIFMIPLSFGLAYILLPERLTVMGVNGVHHVVRGHIGACVTTGIIGQHLISRFTEYYISTNNSASRSRSVTSGGVITQLLLGAGLGFESTIIPITFLAIMFYIGYILADLYGLALVAIGATSIICTFGVLGIFARLSKLSSDILAMVRSQEDREATTILSAMKVSGITYATMNTCIFVCNSSIVFLALLLSYSDENSPINQNETVAINAFLQPITLVFYLFGISYPYMVSSILLNSVQKIVNVITTRSSLESSRDPHHKKNLHYQECITIVHHRSLREMVSCTLINMIIPFLIGSFFGVRALCSFLLSFLVGTISLILFAANLGSIYENITNMRQNITPEIKNGPVLLTSRNECSIGDIERERKATSTCAAIGAPLKVLVAPALNATLLFVISESIMFCGIFYHINGGHGLLGKNNSNTIYK